MTTGDKMAVLITATGEDAPGITAALTSVLAEAGTSILDIEQVVIHNLLTLSMLVEIGEEEKKPLLKDLLYRAKELGVDLDFRLVPERDVILHRSSAQTYIITCLGEYVPTNCIAAVTRALFEKGMNIEKIGKLAWGKLQCLEMTTRASTPISVRELTGYFLDISHDTGVDIAVQRESLYRKAKRLVVMDMDSTLVQVEVIDELAELAGVGERVKDITARAMNGELEFKDALRRRVSLLEGLTSEALERVYRALPLTPGAEKLIKVLKKLGYKIGVISGGFDYFTERLKKDLSLDYAFANRLEVKEGRLTGRIVGEIVDGAMKARLLEEIAARESISLDQVIAIGDGANDLPMLDRAGLGIAFNAKKTVRQAASYSISQKSLDSILYLLGITESELGEV